jgi:hypothetical protein
MTSGATLIIASIGSPSNESSQSGRKLEQNKPNLNHRRVDFALRDSRQ